VNGVRPFNQLFQTNVRQREGWLNNACAGATPGASAVEPWDSRELARSPSSLTPRRRPSVASSGLGRGERAPGAMDRSPPEAPCGRGQISASPWSDGGIPALFERPQQPFAGATSRSGSTRLTAKAHGGVRSRCAARPRSSPASELRTLEERVQVTRTVVLRCRAAPRRSGDRLGSSTTRRPPTSSRR
jgi:hypothetical protein